jgi:DNA-binding NarL/FixJ family response regulator
MAIRVLVADDHQVFQEALGALLDRHQDMQVVGHANDGRTTVCRSRELRPDIVIMDVSMPDLNGIEATRQIVSVCPRVKVIALSIHVEQRFVAGMLNAGASGYVPKECACEELVRAIRTVMAGHTYLSPSVAGAVVDGFVRQRNHPGTNAFTKLTDREREVLQLVAEGKTMKEIADQLYLSVKTVHTHRHHLMEKLDLHSVAALTKYAIREGLTMVEC